MPITPQLDKNNWFPRLTKVGANLVTNLNFLKAEMLQRNVSARLAYSDNNCDKLVKFISKYHHKKRVKTFPGERSSPQRGSSPAGVRRQVGGFRRKRPNERKPVSRSASGWAWGSSCRRSRPRGWTKFSLKNKNMSFYFEESTWSIQGQLKSASSASLESRPRDYFLFIHSLMVHLREGPIGQWWWLSW